ncbi:MAG: 3-deoxy-manno-octulosonate cytidylyltransferase, partial [SAR324 cluster bacterium]|nr:3-deoxy-manno-octulosonate cytidylyltransferase [SAR324 cluster bacterium]
SAQWKNFSIWRHLGVYLFQLDFLLQFHQWPQSVLEHTEQLEQLRILENGETLLCVEAENDSVGVDVPLDVEYAEIMLKRQNSKKA